MIKFIRQIAVCIVLPAYLTNVFPVQAQDRAIRQMLHFARGTNADVNRRIARGTSHVYHFRARRGQDMAVVLKTGKNTSLSVYSVRSGQIDNANGITEWDGTLSDTSRVRHGTEFYHPQNGGFSKSV